MEDNLEKLYQVYEKLSNAEKITEHSEEYVKAIEGSKGSYKEKRLTSQILPKFFKHFPALQEQAIDALLDLCEDSDSSIRICAIKALPQLCKDVKEHLPKVADILAQLLQIDVQDALAVRTSLMQVFKQDPLVVTKAIFHHINNTSESTSREKCLNHLFSFLIKSLDKPNTELEDVLIEECKKALQVAGCNEFIEIIKYLKSSKLNKTLSGQQEILNIIYEQAELDKEFDPLEQESNNVDRLITCVEYALPYYSPKIESNKFVIYICYQVLPQFDLISQLEEGDLKQLQILRHLAQLSTYCGKLESPSLYVVQIFDKIKSYMPLPPENVEVIDAKNVPNLDFSSVECLLYAFHRLARQCPDFLTCDPVVLKDFQTRLLYFMRILQGSSKSLQQSLQSTSVKFLPETKQKAKIAPKLLSNVNLLIRDLFYKPPVYKCNVTLSFLDEDKKIAKAADDSPGSQKRHAPITFDKNSSPKQSRPNKPGENIKLYTPPSGKFSNNFQNYDRAMASRPRGRGRSPRGRGTGRNWRN